MGDSSSNLPLDTVTMTDAISGNMHEEFIKTENLTEDQATIDDCLPRAASINDTCQYSIVNSESSSLEAYLLHKMKWETSSNTKSDMSNYPIVKVENLLETSVDNTCTLEWGNYVKLEAQPGNDAFCHVTTENYEEIVDSHCNASSDFSHETGFHDKTGSSKCTAIVEDKLKYENLSLCANFEDIKTENSSCAITLENVRTENLTSASEPVLQQPSSLYGEDEEMATCSEESQHNPGTQDLITDAFPHTKRHLACTTTTTTEASLDCHLYPFHYDKYSRRRRETRGVSSHTEEGEELPAVVDILNSCDEGLTRVDQDLNTDSMKSRVGNDEEKKSGQIDEKPYKCTICGKGFGHKCTLLCHMRIHSDEKPYACTVCGKAFVVNRHLQKHMRIHSGEKPCTCTVCGKAFVFNNNLRQHLRIHSGEKKYTCTVCGKAFIFNNHLQQHMRIHSGEKPYTCTVCGKCFIRKSGMQRHMKRNTCVEIDQMDEKPYKCTMCSKGYFRHDHLLAHMRTHSSEKPFTCTVCDKGFSYNSGMRRHMRRIHGYEEPCTCTVCGKGFGESDHLRNHMKIHSCDEGLTRVDQDLNTDSMKSRKRHGHSGKKASECTVCGKTFRNDCLQKHIMRIHSGKKPYLCSICGKQYSSSLKAHMTIHSAEKPYTCTVCGKGYGDKSQCRKHERTHSAEKPYTCTVCGKGFNDKSQFRKHERTHSAEKPYTCTVCGKGFSDKSQLGNHERTHSGVKPYTCLVCGRGFRWKYLLKPHMRIHRGEKPYKCTICGKGFRENHSRKIHMMRIHSSENSDTCTLSC